LLANPTGSRKIPMLDTARTNREQARSYKYNQRPVNSYFKGGNSIVQVTMCINKIELSLSVNAHAS
jgi:hypothetical protein